jgi:hypothetical protein
MREILKKLLANMAMYPTFGSPTILLASLSSKCKTDEMLRTLLMH